jgi:hypothetical protein
VVIRSQRLRLLLVAGYGLGTLAWPYSTLMYGHQLLAICAASAFLILINIKTSLGPPLRRSLFTVGTLLGIAAATEYTAALVGLVLMVYTLTWLRNVRQLAWIIAGVIVPGALLAWYHTAAFGGPLTLAYEFSTQSHRSQGFFMGLGAPDPSALYNILLSPYRGLFFSSPWLLAVLATLPMLRRHQWRAELFSCWAILLLFVWMNASLVDWQGGWACGARYLIPAVPFVVIAIAIGVGSLDSSGARTRSIIATIAVAIVVSVGFMLIATSVKPEVPSHLPNPWTDYLWPRFSHGLLSVSTQSIDSKTESNTSATWNLGSAIGLPGLAQLLPLLLIFASAGWLAWRLTRDRQQ